MERTLNLCNFMLRCPESVLCGVCALLFVDSLGISPVGCFRSSPKKKKKEKKKNLEILTRSSESSEISLEGEQKLDLL